MIDADLTWSGHKIYDSSSLDDLISQCDTLDSSDGDHDKSAGPFTVFSSTVNMVSPPRGPPSEMGQILDDLQDDHLRDSAAFLFHHYTSFIALNMMPFKDRRNPWQSFYPLMARCGSSRGHKSLLHAMLAQAAGNLAHLGCKKEYMSTLTVKYYALAIKNLRKGLEDQQEDFSVVLASVLTLIMAEESLFFLQNTKIMTDLYRSTTESPIPGDYTLMGGGTSSVPSKLTHHGTAPKPHG
jgi:hypothetical protein